MRILLTAGPTREPLDPVRYLTNRSSGKMGYAIAAAGVKAGHEVTLISGPVRIAPPADATLVQVETAREMFEAVQREAPAADILIMTAAVADFRAAHQSDTKLKKRALPRNENGNFLLELEPTEDILAALPQWRKPGSLTIGFAAETADHHANALSKLQEKQCDIIVLNDVSRNDIGFGSDENEVKIIFADGHAELWERQSKEEIGHRLIRLATNLWSQKNG